MDGGIIGSGSVGDTDGYTKITDVRQININDKTAVAAEINSFLEAHAYIDVEHALVITRSGKVYGLRGNEITVNPGLIGRNELAGSIVVHNHPMPGADSFSRFDFAFFFDYEPSRLEVVFGSQHHVMRHSGASITPDAASALYREAFDAVRWNAMRTGVPIRNEQLETMRQLSRTMEGLIFDENTRQ